MRMTPAALALAALAAAVFGGCGGPTLEEQLTRTGPAHLLAPRLDGELPFSWFQRGDRAVVLTWGPGGHPLGAESAVLSQAPEGDLCASMPAHFDSCRRLDADAARFGFEEQGAVVVRRDGTLVTWPDLVLEGPDEAGFDLSSALDHLVELTRDAPILEPTEFVNEVEYVD